MTNKFPPYRNTIKTQAKIMAKIAIDLMKYSDRNIGGINVNAFDIPAPPVTVSYLLHIDIIDPTVNDDVSAGYEIGTMWINTVDDTIFICTDDTIGAAVWIEVCCASGSSVLQTASFTVAVNSYTVIDCGAIADDAIDHVCWAVVDTLDGCYHAENRPRAPVLGGVSFMWYKDAGNLKIKVWNDSGTGKTIRAFYA